MEWINAISTILFKKGDRSQCGNYRGISLLSVVGSLHRRDPARAKTASRMDISRITVWLSQRQRHYWWYLYLSSTVHSLCGLHESVGYGQLWTAFHHTWESRLPTKVHKNNQEALYWMMFILDSLSMTNWRRLSSTTVVWSRAANWYLHSSEFTQQSYFGSPSRKSSTLAEYKSDSAMTVIFSINAGSKRRPNFLQNSSERLSTLMTSRFSVIHHKACSLWWHPTTTLQSVWVSQNSSLSLFSIDSSFSIIVSFACGNTLLSTSFVVLVSLPKFQALPLSLLTL